MVEAKELESQSHAIDMSLRSLQAEILMDDENAPWFDRVNDLIPQAIENLPPAIKVGLFPEALAAKDTMAPGELKDTMVGVFRNLGSINRTTLSSGREVVVFGAYEGGVYRLNEKLEKISSDSPDYVYNRNIYVPDLLPNGRAGFLLPEK